MTCMLKWAPWAQFNTYPNQPMCLSQNTYAFYLYACIYIYIYVHGAIYIYIYVYIYIYIHMYAGSWFLASDVSLHWYIHLQVCTCFHLHISREREVDIYLCIHTSIFSTHIYKQHDAPPFRSAVEARRASDKSQIEVRGVGTSTSALAEGFAVTSISGFNSWAFRFRVCLTV